MSTRQCYHHVHQVRARPAPCATKSTAKGPRAHLQVLNREKNHPQIARNHTNQFVCLPTVRAKAIAMLFTLITVCPTNYNIPNQRFKMYHNQFIHHPVVFSFLPVLPRGPEPSRISAAVTGRVEARGASGGVSMWFPLSCI